LAEAYTYSKLVVLVPLHYGQPCHVHLYAVAPKVHYLYERILMTAVKPVFYAAVLLVSLTSARRAAKVGDTPRLILSTGIALSTLGLALSDVARMMYCYDIEKVPTTIKIPALHVLRTPQVLPSTVLLVSGLAAMIAGFIATLRRKIEV